MTSWFESYPHSIFIVCVGYLISLNMTANAPLVKQAAKVLHDHQFPQNKSQTKPCVFSPLLAEGLGPWSLSEPNSSNSPALCDTHIIIFIIWLLTFFQVSCTFPGIRETNRSKWEVIYIRIGLKMAVPTARYVQSIYCWITFVMCDSPSSIY